MFGIDFPELLVCLVVALVVLGPERLPEVVRTTSLWMGRLKRSLSETKQEIERQIGIDDIRRQLHTEEMMRTLDNMRDEIETALNYERMSNKPALENNSYPETIEPTVIEPVTLEPLNIEALNIEALNIEALNIEALNIEAIIIKHNEALTAERLNTQPALEKI